MNYNTENLLVSIIIPVFNVEKYIIRCIDSILRQTYRHIEVILIDDCGKDNSINVARDYIANNPQQDISFSIVSHEENKGVSAARNTGILNSTGKYLFFLDSDDELDPNCIMLLLNSIKKYQAEVAIGNNKIINADNSVRFIDSKLESNFIHNNNTIFQSYLNGLWYNVAWNKLIDRNFLISNSLYFVEGYIHEDELWGYQLAALTTKLSIVTDYTYKYHINPGSIMFRNEILRTNQYLDVVGLMREFTFNHKLHNNPQVQKFFYYKLLTILHTFDKHSALTKEHFKRIQSNVFFNSISLCAQKVIPLKVCVANYFIHLPYFLYRPYNRFISLLSRRNRWL